MPGLCFNFPHARAAARSPRLRLRLRSSLEAEAEAEGEGEGEDEGQGRWKIGSILNSLLWLKTGLDGRLLDFYDLFYFLLCSIFFSSAST